MWPFSAVARCSPARQDRAGASDASGRAKEFVGLTRRSSSTPKRAQMMAKSWDGSPVRGGVTRVRCLRELVYQLFKVSKADDGASLPPCVSPAAPVIQREERSTSPGRSAHRLHSAARVSVVVRHTAGALALQRPTYSSALAEAQRLLARVPLILHLKPGRLSARPARYGESARLATMPSRSNSQTLLNKASP